MVDVRKKIEEIVLLENQIGLLIQKREYALKTGQIVEVEGRILSTREYVRKLTKEIIQYEEERCNIVDVILNSSIDDVYAAYECIANEEKDEYKMERLLTVFDLIERMEENRERGR